MEMSNWYSEQSKSYLADGCRLDRTGYSDVL